MIMNYPADHCNSFNNSTWEEQAFAEDAAGLFGGLVWPPRSYTCSFCGREFKSAQALGGHMNVHRRDRARLKQQQTDFDSTKSFRVSVPLSTPPQDFLGGMRLADHRDGVETNLSMGLNLNGSDQIGHRVHVPSKRPKAGVGRLLPLFLEPCSINGLDLELRLGNPSKVLL